MDRKEKIVLMDMVIAALAKTTGMIPFLIYGYGKFPKDDIEDHKIRIVEAELLERKLVKVLSRYYDPESLAAKIVSHNSTPGGYLELEIDKKGRELIVSGKSVGEIFEAEQKKEDLESKIKELDFKLKDYQTQNFEKDQKIKDLDLSNREFIERNQKKDQEIKDLTLKNASLDNDLKNFQIIKDYGWFITVGVAVASGIFGYYLHGFSF